MPIAFDSSNKYTACVSGTSCTYSFTNTAGNFIVNSSTSYTTDPGVTTMTYAGSSMTQIGSNQTLLATYQYVFYKAAAATGANNIVTTTTNSLTNGFYDHVLSYSGTHSTSPVANSIQSTVSATTSWSITPTITTTATSWAVALTASNLGRTHSAGANTIQRDGDSQGWLFDSNGIASSSPWTLNFTSASADNVLNTAFELKAPVSNITNTAFLLNFINV